MSLAFDPPLAEGGFCTRKISVGPLSIGGDEPLVVQSMTTSDTKDVEKTLEEIHRLIEVGCPLVRLTVPTMKDVEALRQIRHKLFERGYRVPLVADVHFIPKVAFEAAEFVEKVRINPGNFADRKLFKKREYSDQEYQEELHRIHDAFKPLVLKIKSLGRALRIGSNHGSLSDRIMNRYGDTPEGMVQSALEYAEICRQYDFHNFCFSMKASTVSVMVEAYRLLVKRQIERGWDYPIHLGVTEAGDGEDGRIKSAIGIGSLLAEGIGDTIRVSLTESSVREIPVAQELARQFPKTQRPAVYPRTGLNDTERRKSKAPKVWMVYEDWKLDGCPELKMSPDVVWFREPQNLTRTVDSLKNELRKNFNKPDLQFAVDGTDQSFDYQGPKNFVWNREVFLSKTPFDEVLCFKTPDDSLRSLIASSVHMGRHLLEQSYQGLLLEGGGIASKIVWAFSILQTTGRRRSRAEYVACPSCGRTLFDLEETTARIRKKTQHLKSVKIAIMGCIVNGPGEMADADFGYVGGAPGRVHLYVGKQCIERNIPSEQAPERLVELIKQEGFWVDPS